MRSVSQARRVVVVEDDPEIRSLLEFALERDGFEVTACSSGREAIGVVREREPDLQQLLDLLMQSNGGRMPFDGQWDGPMNGPLGGQDGGQWGSPHGYSQGS